MPRGVPPSPTAPGRHPAHRQDARPRGASGWAATLLPPLLLLPAALGPLATRTAMAQAARAVGGVVTEVVVKGQSSIPVEQIRAKIKTRAGREYDERLIEQDVQSLLSSSWFADVQTFYRKDPKTPDGLIITFEVTELPVLRAVEFRGLSKLKLKEVEESTGLKVGARADFLKCQAAVGQIQRMYADKGYEWASVRLLEGGKPGDTRAVFEIFEGPKCRLRSVTFTGNAFVSGGVLRTKIASRTAILGLGGTFHRDEMEDDARKLREYYLGQGFFEVKIRPVVRRDANMGDVHVEYVIWEGVQFKVRDVRFEGNKLIPTHRLREGLVMHSGQPFSDTLRDADRKNLQAKYGSIGCIDAQVSVEHEYADPEKSPGVVDLVYKIDEGVPYRLGRLIPKGNSRTLNAVILREANMAGLVPGEPIDAQRIEKFQQRLSNLRFFAVSPDQGKPIEIKLVNRRSADRPFQGSADLDVQPAGFLGMGQPRLQNPEVDDLLGELPPPAEPLAPGPGPAGVAPMGGGAADPFAPPLDAPVVAPPIAAPAPAPRLAPPADVSAVPGTVPLGADVPPGLQPSIPGMNMNDVGPDRQEPFGNRSFADIVTSVEEVPTGRLMFGVGASSFQGLSGNFILHETNFDLFNFPRSFGDFFNGRAFRGRGQDFRIELSPGTAVNRAVVSFRDPYVFNLPVAFGASGYTFRRFYPDWTEDRGGGRFSLGQQFGTLTYADVAFRIEDVNLHGFKIPAPAEYLAAQGHTTLATIRPSLRFDNRNDPFAPNRGFYFEGAFEQGWGTFTFPKLTLEGRQYLTTGSRPDGSGKRILTFREFYGITGSDTPVYERFFAGDWRSLRGFAYRGVGPHVYGQNVGGLQMFLGSVEYQFPWTANDKLQQVFFCDFGTLDNDFSFNDWRVAVGTGLRIYLPQQVFGPLPLAFDLAFPLVKEDGDRTRYFTFFIGAFW